MGCGSNGIVRKTPLAEVHKNLGATMVDFAGWYMPMQYTSVIDEHTTTRTKAGLFDICHMGEFIVKGKGSFNFLQKMAVNDLNKLTVGKAIFNILCYENGTVIDDLFIYKLKENEYMIVVNACNIQKDLEWLKKHKGNFEVEINDVSDQTAKLDLQGPLSEKILRKLTSAELPKRFHFIETELSEIRTIISRTGYTGEDGFEFYFPAENAEKIWTEILDAGEEYGIKPIGLGARDTLRIEACYPLYGHETNDKITPIEVGLGWLVKTEKEDFIGKEILKKQKEHGTERILVVFEMVDRGIARENYEIFANNEKIGHVTSGTFSPTFRKSLGMALIKKPFSEIGNELNIKIKGKLHKAKIVKRPFYEYKGGQKWKTQKILNTPKTMNGLR
tara:strand:- start:6321 stop:7487 length:1167 start_codon:yes stop_codon:yes gene_type:complete